MGDLVLIDLVGDLDLVGEVDPGLNVLGDSSLLDLGDSGLLGDGGVSIVLLLNSGEVFSFE